jgi:subtilisin family serine protease
MMISLSIFAQQGFNKASRELNDLLNAGSDNDKHLVWVFFNDKGENLSHYFTNPESVVSERSLKRRSKVLPQGELISMMDLPVNQQYISELENLGFKVKQVSKWFNGVSGYVTKSETGMISALASVKKLDIVIKFKKDYSFEESTGAPQINSVDKPNGVNSYAYGQSEDQIFQINVHLVHDLGYTGEGVLICSMDAGFDNLSHEVFDSMNIVDKWDFVNNDPDPVEGGSHGTSTLSTIGGFKEDKLIGPAFKSDYLLARTEDIYSETPIEEDNWIAALEWADQRGADVTTTSLSYLTYDPPFTSYTWEDMDGNTALITIAADLAVKLGIVVVNSAGNEYFHPDHNTLGAPADGDSVITVGAVTSSGNRSIFSSVGPTVDGRIKPDLMAMGSYVYVARSSSPTSYGHSDGTSFSCPLLAGAAALLLSVDPSLTPMELLDLLRQTASQSNNPDNLMGWGIINTFAAVNSLLTTDVSDETPEDFYILRNYPNPFNPSTTINYSIPRQSNIKITVYDIIGNELEILFEGVQQSGAHEIDFIAENKPSGVYLISLTANDFVKTIKTTLIK